ncbi:MAG TPA: tellurite resistance TerB family protein [Stellaceae bacterium]|nr:tellurite resistance TerB family protein [Stellaceae bacterium]
MIDPHAALIYIMVMVAAADSHMADSELQIIGDIVNHLPIFGDYDKKRVTRDLKDCATMLGREAGLEDALKTVKGALPAKLRETAYALACDVAAAGGDLSQETLRLLELLRHRLNVDRLVAAAIERGARARFTRI